MRAIKLTAARIKPNARCVKSGSSQQIIGLEVRPVVQCPLTEPNESS